MPGSSEADPRGGLTCNGMVPGARASMSDKP
jgi:hypothetical protein